jgi:hypothetical protein
MGIGILSFRDRSKLAKVVSQVSKIVSSKTDHNCKNCTHRTLQGKHSRSSTTTPAHCIILPNAAVWLEVKGATRTEEWLEKCPPQ